MPIFDHLPSKEKFLIQLCLLRPVLPTGYKLKWCLLKQHVSQVFPVFLRSFSAMQITCKHSISPFCLSIRFNTLDQGENIYCKNYLPSTILRIKEGDWCLQISFVNNNSIPDNERWEHHLERVQVFNKFSTLEHYSSVSCENE